MAKTSFKLIPIQTVTKPIAKPTATNTITTADLTKTHFVINSLQTNTQNAFNSVLSNTLMGGKLLLDVVLIAGQPNYVNHPLGQALNGWFMSRPQGFTMLYEDEASNKSPDKQIILYTYIDTTIDLYVF